MKSFEIDAKNFIRSYIDSVEEYLRKHTQLHPNEIDGLLNEINDFIYLRSEELCRGKKVQYADVLKAIEECGSPSEIGEQYHDLDSTEPLERFSPKSQQKIGTSLRKTVSKAFSSSKREEDSDEGTVQSASKFISIYRISPLFTAYRLIFLWIVGLALLALITYDPFSMHKFYTWLYSSDIYVIDFDQVSNWAYNLAISSIILLLLLFGWEGYIVDRIKERLFLKQNANRRIDDLVLIWISRLTITTIILKMSLYYYHHYTLFFALVFLLIVVLIERRFYSQFWTEKLAPLFANLGAKLLQVSDTTPQPQIRSFKSYYQQLTKPEKLLGFVLLVTFLSTFIYPWMYLPSFLSPLYSHYHYFNAFSFEDYTQIQAGVFIFLSLIALTFAIGSIIYYRYKADNSLDPTLFNSESDLITWLIRLLTLKGLLIAAFLPDQIGRSYAYILLITMLIIAEIATNRFGGDVLRSLFGYTLLSLGTTEDSALPDKFNFPVEIMRSIPRHKAESESITPHIESMSKTPPKIYSRPIEVHPPPEILQKPIVVQQSAPPSAFRRGISLFLKSIFLTFEMLFLSFYEAILAFIIILTTNNLEGSYSVPLFQFNVAGTFLHEMFWDQVGYTGILTIGGFTIWTWYALGMLTVQLIFVNILDWYSIIARNSKDVIALIGRNLSRIFLLCLLGYVINYLWTNDPYLILQMLILVGLVVFSETSAWKIRSERKKLDRELKLQEDKGRNNSISVN
ncbi:MAG: hypothetical protein EAX86_05095 [Candidatus Heimdallarchaeota archaeon]|nr:hypothetical protein [Candidatus Heimdallarchaeota archaeon]